jgi:YDG domain
LGGADSANYVLGSPIDTAGLTAKITPKTLSVTGITASDKAYDGTTTVALNSTSAQVSGSIAGDSVSLSTQNAKGDTASKNVTFDANGVVTSQAVTISGLSLNGQDAGNYAVADKSGATVKLLQRVLSIIGSVAQDKTVDGTTQAKVTPGQLGNLVEGDDLLVTASGQFDNANLGTNKAVTTQYNLANGRTGVASNYALAGQVLRASILAASVNPVQSIISPAKQASNGRVVVAGSGTSGAAVGVADQEDDIIARQECSVLNPEKCECQTSVITGVELCFAPSLLRVSNLQ